MIQGIRNLTYKNILKQHSLGRCKVRGDLIVFKWIQQGGYKQGFHSQGTNDFKQDKFKFRKEIWFTNRVVEEWNKLSKHVVSVRTVDILKKR